MGALGDAESPCLLSDCPSTFCWKQSEAAARDQFRAGSSQAQQPKK